MKPKKMISFFSFLMLPLTNILAVAGIRVSPAELTTRAANTFAIFARILDYFTLLSYTSPLALAHANVFSQFMQKGCNFISTTNYDWRDLVRRWKGDDIAVDALKTHTRSRAQNEQPIHAWVGFVQTEFLINPWSQTPRAHTHTQHGWNALSANVAVFI